MNRRLPYDEKQLDKSVREYLEKMDNTIKKIKQENPIKPKNSLELVSIMNYMAE